MFSIATSRVYAKQLQGLNGQRQVINTHCWLSVVINERRPAEESSTKSLREGMLVSWSVGIAATLLRPVACDSDAEFIS